MAWPPTLQDLKDDLGINDPRDDATLQRQLDAAIAYVTRVKGDEYGLFDTNADTELGTVRLAGRFYTRRRSPDGIVAMGELGTATVPALDSDIEKLLEIGRFGGSVIV